MMTRSNFFLQLFFYASTEIRMQQFFDYLITEHLTVGLSYELRTCEFKVLQSSVNEITHSHTSTTGEKQVMNP